MFHRISKHNVAIALLAGAALIVQGCSSSPTEPEVTLEDLTAELRIQMAANADEDGGASAGSNAFRGSNVFEAEPSENQFQVRGPNTNVFTWPIIQDTPISGRWQGGDIGEHIVLSWPASHFPTNIWPNLDVAGGIRFGNVWTVFPAGGNPNDWVAQHVEWIRRAANEQTGSNFPFDEKLLGSRPCLECPIGLFIAGPSRHVPDEPAYRRRTAIKWFRYRDLSPWVWQEGGGGGGGEEEPEAELEEVHVFVQKFSFKTDNGTEVLFNDVNRDIDLMTLRGQAIDVVNSEIPRGTFTDLTFFIDTTQSYVVIDGQPITLHFPTGTVVVEGPIVVGESPITTVRLEFHVEESLSENPDGSWTMNPVVAIGVTTS